MLEVLAPIARAACLQIPVEHRRCIGIVGAGAIVEYAHLPAYLTAGIEVAAIYDVKPERARELADRHGIHAAQSLTEILADERVEVVDVAVVPWAQPEIVRAALAAGKHVLCQKPLALDLATARELVEAAERHNLKLAVNQQLRFDEGIRAAWEMVGRGWVGEVSCVSFDVDILTEWDAWPWLITSDRLEIMFHSIHYLDAVRALLGDPNLVYSATGRTSGQKPKAETRSINVLSFPSGARAICHANHESRAANNLAAFRVDGSAGTIRGTLGLLYDYPHGRPDTLAVRSDVLPTDGWLAYPVTTRWLPDAFAGPMGSLLRAIAEDSEPETGGRDNLRTLELVHALYRSAETGEAQLLGDTGA